MEEMNKEEFKDTLAGEFSRSKEVVRTKIDKLTSSKLKRLLKVFTGVFHNEVQITDDEMQFIEDAKKAMENFISIQQAEGEIPE